MYHLDPDKEHNFFTMMCEVLGIRVIPTRSPPAKGCVKRYDGKTPYPFNETWWSTIYEKHKQILATISDRS